MRLLTPDHVLPGQPGYGESVGPPHEINCAGFWDALVLKHLLEGNGVQVHPPQEEVFLTLTASGPLDVINAAVAELAGKYLPSGPFIVDGMEQVPSAAQSGASAEAPPTARRRPLPGASQRCVATTAKGSRCKLPAVPSGARCAIHASQRGYEP